MFELAMPFWACIGLLSVAQGVIVALPRAQPPPGRLSRLNSSWWALLPAGSLVGFVLVAQLSEARSALALTYVALVAVPPLAALALAKLGRGSRQAMALVVLPLFALAWADRAGLAGEAAALLLSGLSCVALGVLIASVTPARWLASGIVAMALADVALVVADQLQQPNSVLSAAHPAASLPRLQAAIFGSASMGFGDLFVAGVLGGLLAFKLGGRVQLIGAALVAGLALAFDLLFFVVNELPATVPVAAGLMAIEVARRRGAMRSAQESSEAIARS
jgi:hypothetical protein